MTQLFMGYKPSVGPVVKVLKYDTDDPLTLANDAYDRYLYNSENDHISYIFEPRTWYFSYSGYPPTGLTSIDGGKYRILRSYSTSNSDTVGVYAMKDELVGSGSYLPIIEGRYRLADGRVIGNDCNASLFDGVTVGVVTTSSFTSFWAKTKSFGATPIWQTRFPSGLSSIGLDKWVGCYGRGAGARDQGTIQKESQIGSFSGNPYPNPDLITCLWDLPADASPMRTYTTVPSLEIFRMNQSQVVMSRPGYSVDGSSGRSQRIIDSDSAPALCVMSGDSASIPSNGSIDIPVPYGYVLSENAIVEMLVRNSGDEMYLPAKLSRGSGSVVTRQLYKIFPTHITLWNNSPSSIIVRYMVFDADTRPNTTGGNQIMSRETYGGDDYIRIKKPFTSDTTTQPNDIILDTRLPMVQIVKEGYIPAASFSTAIAENQRTLGNRAFQVDFDNDGFLPFVKYSLVFNDYTMPPINAQKIGVPIGPSSNQSSLCRLGTDYAKFWINTGNWSRLGNASQLYQEIYDMPNPIGIRYYIFAIARTDT